MKTVLKHRHTEFTKTSGEKERKHYGNTVIFYFDTHIGWPLPRGELCQSAPALLRNFLFGALPSGHVGGNVLVPEEMCLQLAAP